MSPEAVAMLIAELSSKYVNFSAAHATLILPTGKSSCYLTNLFSEITLTMLIITAASCSLSANEFIILHKTSINGLIMYPIMMAVM